MGPVRPSVESIDTAAFLNPADRSEHVEKQASYPGEDTSYTSQRELNGWSQLPTSEAYDLGTCIPGHPRYLQRFVQLFSSL